MTRFAVRTLTLCRFLDDAGHGLRQDLGAKDLAGHVAHSLVAGELAERERRRRGAELKFLAADDIAGAELLHRRRGRHLIGDRLIDRPREAGGRHADRQPRQRFS